MPGSDASDRDTPPVDDRAGYAKALDWVNRILAASFTTALPAVGGYFLDRWMSTAPWFLVTGALCGLLFGFWQIYQLARLSDEAERHSDSE
jgi:F0F1-type ATP synthase assembly protein I